MKPTTHFELSVQDVLLIEMALADKMRNLYISSVQENVTATSYHMINEEAKRINSLLGKIHNQKTWYRPKDTYISG
jgi:hypothetical protein